MNGYKAQNEFNKTIPDEYDFSYRIDQHRKATGAGDKVNVMLKYGYALLEAEYIRAIMSKSN